MRRLYWKKLIRKLFRSVISNTWNKFTKLLRIFDFVLSMRFVWAVYWFSWQKITLEILLVNTWVDGDRMTQIHLRRRIGTTSLVSVCALAWLRCCLNAHTLTSVVGNQCAVFGFRLSLMHILNAHTQIGCCEFVFVRIRTSRKHMVVVSARYRSSSLCDDNEWHCRDVVCCCSYFHEFQNIWLQ